MLYNLIGDLGVPGAVVLVMFFVAVASVVIVSITVHKDPRDYEQEKARLQLEHERVMYDKETIRNEKIAALEQNLITSHAVDQSDRSGHG